MQGTAFALFPRLQALLRPLHRRRRPARLHTASPRCRHHHHRLPRRPLLRPRRLHHHFGLARGNAWSFLAPTPERKRSHGATTKAGGQAPAARTNPPKSSTARYTMESYCPHRRPHLHLRRQRRRRRPHRVHRRPRRRRRLRPHRRRLRPPRRRLFRFLPPPQLRRLRPLHRCFPRLRASK